MATRFSPTLLGDVTTDARFRANAQFIEDTLVTTGGWLVTSDTGQTLPSALVHPTVANTKQGYRIYKMNDALAATFPVFVRIDFGSSSSLNIMALWVTIGTGSDGSGNITNILHNGGARLQGFGQNTPGTSVGNSYGSAFHNRFTFALWVTIASIANAQVMGLERSKDSTGSDTGDGLIFFWTDYANGSSYIGPSNIRYLILAGGTQPAQDLGLNYNLSTNGVTESWIPGDTQVALPFAFKGVAQQAGMNLALVNSGDISAEGNFTANIYGRTVTYQHCNNVYVYKGLSGASPNSDLNVRVAIRYD